MKRILLFVICMFVINVSAYSQQILEFKKVVYVLTLSSPSARMIDLIATQERLSWRNFQLQQMPSLSFNVNPINYNQSVRPLQDPNTSEYRYIDDYSNNSYIGATLSQPVNFTGGTLSLSSNLNVLSEFNRSLNTFNATPFSIGYRQALFGGRKSYLFTRKLQKIARDKLTKVQQQSLYEIQYYVVQTYMRALTAKLSIENGSKYAAVADTLLHFSKLRYDLNDITEQEHIQAELQSIKSHYEVDNAKREYNEAMHVLLSYLGIEQEDYLVLLPNIILPDHIDYEFAFEEFRKNSPFYEEQEQRKIESERTLYSARLRNMFNADISLNYGTNQYGNGLHDAYHRTNSRQSIILGLSIPVFNWGINRNDHDISKAQYESTQIDIMKSEVEMVDRLRADVNLYNQNILLLDIFYRSYQLACRQYELMVDEYKLGRVSFVDISVSQKQMMDAEQSYKDTLSTVWEQYYSLRAIALCDFGITI